MSLVQEQERNLLFMSKIYLDKVGYENYLKSLEDIKKEIDDNAKLMSLYASDDAYGDGWHDNFAYEETMHKEAELFQKYNKKKSMLKDIVIVDKESNGTVSLNMKVEILFIDDEEIEEYIITGDINSNIDDNSITLNSPLGSVIYGKKVGDTVSYKVGDNVYSIEILGIVAND